MIANSLHQNKFNKYKNPGNNLKNLMAKLVKIRIIIVWLKNMSCMLLNYEWDYVNIVFAVSLNEFG